VKNGVNSLTSNGGSTSSGTSSGDSTGGDTSSDGNALIFGNDPKTTLMIEKYVTGTTNSLKGVTFLVTDSSGVVVGSPNSEYITDENGRIVIKRLEPGITVTVRETKAVEGYILDTAPKSIKIKTGEAQILHFYNSKQDEETRERIKEVQFEVRKLNGEIADT